MSLPFVILTDIIDEAERQELHDYALVLQHRGELRENQYGPGRFHREIWDTEFLTPTIRAVGKRIEERFGITDYPVDSYLGWVISVHLPGAFVHPHTDDVDYRDGTKNHFRCNLVVSKPESGGIPIIGMKPVPMAERSGWAFFASKSEHLSTPVGGEKPRITYQFGYATPAGWLPEELQGVAELVD